MVAGMVIGLPFGKRSGNKQGHKNPLFSLFLRGEFVVSALQSNDASPRAYSELWHGLDLSY